MSAADGVVLARYQHDAAGGGLEAAVPQRLSGRDLHRGVLPVHVDDRIGPSSRCRDLRAGAQPGPLRLSAAPPAAAIATNTADAAASADHRQTSPQRASRRASPTCRRIDPSRETRKQL